MNVSIYCLRRDMGADLIEFAAEIEEGATWRKLTWVIFPRVR